MATYGVYSHTVTQPTSQTTLYLFRKFQKKRYFISVEKIRVLTFLFSELCFQHFKAFKRCFKIFLKLIFPVREGAIVLVGKWGGAM